MLNKLPVQPAGWVVFGVGLSSLLGAVLLNWRELLVLAIGCGAILLVSLAFVIGRSEIRLVRQLDNDRVSVGSDATVALLATNSGSVRTTRQVIREAFDSTAVSVDLPPLSPGSETTVTWSPPTNRRGRFPLGPARITKTDPCRLMQRDVGQTGVDELWVQPRVVPLAAFVGGLTKDVDGPTFDHSPAGDVAFHAIRPYEPGDDARHVHWMATARAGEMMVKHYVDNRQPHVTVLLDTNAASWRTDQDFDLGVEIAASVAVSSLDASHPCSLFAGSNQLVGSRRRSTRQLVLDDLTIVETDEVFPLADAMGAHVGGERNTTIAVVVTGVEPDGGTLRVPLTRLAQTCGVVLIRAGAGAFSDDAAVTGRGVRYVEVSDLDELSGELRAANVG